MFVISEVRENQALAFRKEFRNRKQKENEKFEDFYEDLAELAKFCRFRHSSKMIREQIVFGLSDLGLHKRLVELGNPSLDSVVSMCKNGGVHGLVDDVVDLTGDDDSDDERSGEILEYKVDIRSEEPVT